MSVLHRIKCSRKEADEFKKIVKDYLDSNNLFYRKIIALTAYEGEVKVFNGRETTRNSYRRVRQYDNKGCYLTRKDIKGKEYTSVYRVDWKENPKEEQEALKTFCIQSKDKIDWLKKTRGIYA